MGGLGGSEQQYSLRWNDFHSSILSSFRHLRDQEDFVDVTLACDGCSFTAHKVVLSACSPYFRTLLKANPCQHPIVILRDVREQDMEALLRFMYNGEVHIGQEQLSDFLKTAQTLQVRGLADVPTKEQQKLLTGGGAPPPPNWVNNTEHGSPHLPPSDAGSPPPKRSRSSELTSQPMNRFSPSPANNNNNNSNNNNSTHGENNTRESLLSQALESSHNNNMSINNNQVKGNSDSSVHAQSTGEESNSSDTGLSERGNGPHPMGDLIQPKAEPADYSQDHHNNSMVMDPTRTPNFPAALLGLQGLPGLLPGPSGMHNSGPDNSFGGEKPFCRECGRVYSSISNLRQHMANVHSSGPWVQCNICHKFFKTRQYLYNHLLQTHGIRQRTNKNFYYNMNSNPNYFERGLDMMRVRATDPRPCPKCGKIYRSAHTLRTHLEDKHTVCPGYRCVLCGTVAKSRNSLHSHMSRQHRGISTKDLPVLPMPSPFDPELASRLLAKAGVKVSAAELRARSSPTGPPRPRPDIRLDLKSPDDPEDLTMNSHHAASRFCAVDIRPLSPPPPQSPHGKPLTGSAILDTYLQFIAENSSNLHLSAEQAAKVAGKISEEQRRLALMDDRTMEESSEPEDEYSEEEREPEPIKAE